MEDQSVIPHSTLITNVALHTRLEDELRQRLAAGEWQVGATFPSRRELARYYNVALRTVEKAIANLLSDGTLKAAKGRGTIVACLQSLTDPRDTIATTIVHAPPSPSPAAFGPVLGILALHQGSLDDIAIEYDYHWVPRAVRALERQFSRLGGSTRFAHVRYPETPKQNAMDDAINSLLARGAQTLAVIEIFGNSDENILSEVLSINERVPVPVVLITWTDILSSIPHVFYDNRYAGLQAADHLLRAGYRQLVFLAPYTAKWVEERFAGCDAAVRQAGYADASLKRYPIRLENILHLVEPCVRESEVAQQFISEILQRQRTVNTPPPGIIAVNDAMAVRFQRRASTLGFVAGRDYGLIGFDDRPDACELDITSLHTPLEDMGKEAALLAHRAIQGENIPIQVRLQSEVIVRASSSRAKAPLIR